MQLVIREPTTTDLPLVLSSWKQSYLDITDAHPKGYVYLGLMDRRTYFDAQERLIRALWTRSQTIVACHPDYPDQVFGWLCFTAPDILHYVYTRHPWRKMAVASDLLRQAFAGFKVSPIAYTHHTHHMHYRAPGWRATYNPYLLFALVTP